MAVSVFKKQNLEYTEFPLGFSAFMVNSGGAQVTRSSSVPNFPKLHDMSHNKLGLWERSFTGPG